MKKKLKNPPKKIFKKRSGSHPPVLTSVAGERLLKNTNAATQAKVFRLNVQDCTLLVTIYTACILKAELCPARDLDT
jgi:hypothetical protein